MSRLSLLILLVATICFSTINVEAQRQLRAVSLDNKETRRQLSTVSPSTADTFDPTEGASSVSAGLASEDQKGNGSTSAPTEAATPAEADSTAAPTEAASTATPAGADSTAAPTEADSTASPTEADSTASPVNKAEEETTASPTEADSTATPAEADSTAAPTEADSTESPTEADSSASPVNKAGEETTASPTEADSTASPTEADSTASPTEADSTAGPTDADSTVGPTEADSTVAPTEADSTADPTEAATTAEPTEAATTAAPSDTVVPTMDETFSPTEAKVEGDCTDNATTYQVMVDLQATYFTDTEEQDRKCSTKEDKEIAAIISAALNSAFPLKVTNWDGDAKFGDFEFDDQQTYDDISEYTGMRQLRGRMLEAAKRLMETRRREEVMTCPLRGNLPCASGYCMWGCLEAATTNCGEDDSTELWAAMAEDVKNQLVTLATENGRGNSGKGFDCLGNLEEMLVIVTLDAGETDAPTVAPTEPEETRSGPEAPAPTAYPTWHFADEGAEVPITTIMEVAYFDKNHGGDLDKSSGVALQLMKELSMFIESILWQHPVYGDHFNGMAEAHLGTQWLEESQTLKLTFSTIIYFTSLDAITDTDKSLAHTITTEGNFHDFIKELRQHKCKDGIKQEDCGKYMTGIKRISFAGTGTGR